MAVAGGHLSRRLSSSSGLQQATWQFNELITPLATSHKSSFFVQPRIKHCLQVGWRSFAHLLPESIPLLRFTECSPDNSFCFLPLFLCGLLRCLHLIITALLLVVCSTCT